MKRVIARCAGAVMLVVLLFGVRPVGADTLEFTEDRAVERALQQNPELLLVQADVDVARGRLRGASLLLQGNPELELAGGPHFGVQGDTADFEVGLSQPVELAGQRSARIEAASASVEAAKARVVAKRLDIVAAVRRAFAAALLAEQRRTLAAAGAALARQALETAEARFQEGSGTRIDVNAARIEFGLSQRLVREAGLRITAATAELRTLLGLDSAVEVVLRGELPQAGGAEMVDTVALVELAIATRPELVAARMDLEGARASARLASREAVPTPRLGAAYSRDEGDDIIQATLAIDLPIFNRNQAARAQSNALVSQARTALEANERAVRQQVELAATRLASAEAAAADLHGSVSTASEENLRLVSEGYEAGKLSLLELLLVRQAALNASASYLDALEELVAARAELERAVGGREQSAGMRRGNDEG